MKQKSRFIHKASHVEDHLAYKIVQVVLGACWVHFCVYVWTGKHFDLSAPDITFFIEGL